MDARAAVPGVLDLATTWHPDLVLQEVAEFAGPHGRRPPRHPVRDGRHFRPRDAAPASPPPAMVCHGGFGTVLGALPDVDAAAAVLAEVAAEGAPVQG